MEYSRTKKTFLNAAAGIAVKMIGIITTFLTRTVFIYVLGIEYAGVSSVFTDVLTVLSFAELGIGSAITYALYKPIADNDEDRIIRLMSAYRKIYTLIAGVIFGVGLLLLPFLDVIITNVPNITENIKLIYILYLFNTAVSYLLIYKATFLTAAQKDYLVSKIKVFLSLAKAVIECIILLLTHNFIVYLVLSILFSLGQNIAIAKIAEKEYPILKQKSKLGLEKQEKRKLFNDVKALALYKVSNTVLNGTDSLITSMILGTPVVGVLGNYNLISNQLYSFLMQIFGATSASIGNLAVTSDKKHQFEIFNKMLFLCFWIYSFCATCLWVLFNPFMMVWQGAGRIFSLTTVAFIVIEFYIRGMLSPITQFRTSNGLFVQGKYRPVIMAVLNILISVVLAKKIGISGIILGTIISRALTQLWYDPWLIFKYVFNESIKKYFLKYLFYGLLTFCFCAVTQILASIICPQLGITRFFVGLILSLAIPNICIVLIFNKTTEFKEVIKLFVLLLKRKIK